MDKIVIITGVSREMGLGYETARQLKDFGFKVIITARDLGIVSNIADQLKVTAKQLDVIDDISVNKLAKEIENEYGKLDVLVNNEGAFFDQEGEPLSTDLQYVKDAFDTNLLGAWRMIKAFHKLLEKSDQPRIVNVSSGAGSFGDPVFGLAHHFSKVPV